MGLILMDLGLGCFFGVDSLFLSLIFSSVVFWFIAAIIDGVFMVVCHCFCSCLMGYFSV